MIFILEGPDGAGKSTLANTLHVMTGYPIVHRTKPKNEKEKEQMMNHYCGAIGRNDNEIWDRGFHSEMVYGNIMRDKSYISLEEMWKLERSMSGILIYCTADIDVLWERCLHRGEEYIKERETLEQIKKEFDRLMHEVYHAIPVVTYDGESMQKLWRNNGD